MMNSVDGIVVLSEAAAGWEETVKWWRWLLEWSALISVYSHIHGRGEERDKLKERKTVDGKRVIKSEKRGKERKLQGKKIYYKTTYKTPNQRKKNAAKPHTLRLRRLTPLPLGPKSTFPIQQKHSMPAFNLLCIRTGNSIETIFFPPLATLLENKAT